MSDYRHRPEIVAPHGTQAAYRRHLYWFEDTCDACRAYMAAKRAAWRAETVAEASAALGRPVTQRAAARWRAQHAPRPNPLRRAA
jgi:hypothetical protein